MTNSSELALTISKIITEKANIPSRWVLSGRYHRKYKCYFNMAQPRGQRSSEVLFNNGICYECQGLCVIVGHIVWLAPKLDNLQTTPPSLHRGQRHHPLRWQGSASKKSKSAHSNMRKSGDASVNTGVIFCVENQDEKHLYLHYIGQDNDRGWSRQSRQGQNRCTPLSLLHAEALQRISPVSWDRLQSSLSPVRKTLLV